ncbi:MAG: glycosyltransferase family 2 protein [Enterococcus sp.]|nr:glycosyltransferase family 2 protein [Enterococcus sp.]
MMLSLIIPIYNASTYLAFSLESLLSQPFQDFELILVDDGSTDASPSICDEYAAKDERIRVLHEPHSGVANSRQVGLEAAKGMYILYVDADDQVDPCMIADMYQVAVDQEADMVLCDYRELTHEGEVYRKQEPTALDGVAVLEDILDGKLYGALWNKMMRREWLLQTKAAFPQRLTMREDLVFLSQCLPYASKIAYLPKAYYGYERRNASALTSHYVNESPAYYQQECLWVDLILENQFLLESTRQRLQTYLLELAYITLKSGLFDKPKWNAVFLKHPEILSYGTGYKKKMVSLAFNGHFALARLLRTFISHLKS